jgi:hypothetical protein
MAIAHWWNKKRQLMIIKYYEKIGVSKEKLQTIKFPIGGNFTSEADWKAAYNAPNYDSVQGSDWYNCHLYTDNLDERREIINTHTYMAIASNKSLYDKLTGCDILGLM